MRKAVYQQVFNLFASELLDTEKDVEIDMVLSIMSHLVAWKRDNKMNVLVPDHYFLKVLLPKFEEILDTKLKANK